MKRRRWGLKDGFVGQEEGGGGVSVGKGGGTGRGGMELKMVAMKGGYGWRYALVDALQKGFAYRNVSVVNVLCGQHCFLSVKAVQLWVRLGLVSSEEEGFKEGNELVRLRVLWPVLRRKSFSSRRAWFRIHAGNVDQVLLAPASAHVFRNWDAEEMVMLLQNADVIRPRRRKLRTYPPSFTGAEAVKLWIATGTVTDSFEAVCLGRKLLETGYIQHLGSDCKFKDSDRLYAVVEDDCTNTWDWFGAAGECFTEDELYKGKASVDMNCEEGRVKLENLSMSNLSSSIVGKLGDLRR